MIETPLFRATRSKRVERRLLIRILAGSAFIGSFIIWEWTDGFNWIEILGLLVVGGLLSLQTATFMTSKFPLTIFQDRIEIRSILRITVAREKLTGLVVHPKRGTPAFQYSDPVKGFEGPIAISWLFIAEDQATVLDAIKQHYGFVLEEACA